MVNEVIAVSYQREPLIDDVVGKYDRANRVTAPQSRDDRAITNILNQSCRKKR